MDNELLVANIKNLCKSNGTPISQLEKDLGFGAGLISRWAKADPSLSKIIDIANYFHVSLDELTGYEKTYEENQCIKFINSVYERTESKQLIWSTNDEGNKNAEAYDFSKENRRYVGWNSEYYYCKFEEGYFMLNVHYLLIKYEITDTDLKFYIQPDTNSDPVLYCEGENLLGELWNYLRTQFYGTLEETKANQLVTKFIEPNGIIYIKKNSDALLTEYYKQLLELKNSTKKSQEQMEKILYTIDRQIKLSKRNNSD